MVCRRTDSCCCLRRLPAHLRKSANEPLRACSRLRTPYMHLLDVLDIQGLPENICQHLSARDTLSLSSVSKALHTWLMDEVPATIWKVTFLASVTSAPIYCWATQNILAEKCDSLCLGLQGVCNEDVAPGYLASLAAKSSRHVRASIKHARAAKRRSRGGMPPQWALAIVLAKRQSECQQLLFSACGQYLAVVSLKGCP